jgi:hypothetical protein
MSWSIKKRDGGYVVLWDGLSWGMLPASREWCVGYVERLKVRYPGGGGWLVKSYEGPSRTRGGPWRYTMADGTTEVIHTGRLSDAKTVLRHGLRRKTLPRGITWKLELEK